MGYLEKFAREKKEPRSETLTARVTKTTYDRFAEHCARLKIPISEAVALLIEREVYESEKEVSTRQPREEYKPNTTEPRQRQKRFTTNPYVVNDMLPCPICETWPETQRNISRHMRKMHGQTTQEVYEAYMDKVLKMVEEERKK